MERFLGKYESYVYAILRIVTGALFLMHGTQKLFGLPPGQPGMQLNGLLTAAAVIELVCGALIALGLFAGWAAFLASGEMAVAYFMVHFPQSPLPIVNHGAEAVLDCFIFLYIATRGAGPWSIDQAFTRRV
jgi:putative oxidoreductase